MSHVSCNLFLKIMPELPEVETIKRQLERAVKGRAVLDVEVIKAKKINVSAKEFVKAVKGAKIKDVGRRAKMLLLGFGNGWTAVIHLKMTGRILFTDVSAKPGRHTFVVFTLSGGKKLFWDDMRTFGYLKLMKTDKLKEFLKEMNLGPEPFEAGFTPKVLKACLLRAGKRKIKPLLMEQKCVAGVGNIYAAEILAFAGVHPGRRAESLDDKEIAKLYSGLKKILTSAIAARGSSADDYVDLHGKAGTFVPKLKVYGREGERCAYCNGKIKKISLGGRGTYFCPKHQK